MLRDSGTLSRYTAYVCLPGPWQGEADTNFKSTDRKAEINDNAFAIKTKSFSNSMYETITQAL